MKSDQAYRLWYVSTASPLFVFRSQADQQDNLAGVNVEINAVLIMQTLFGFELGNYYRSVLSLLLIFPSPLPDI